MEQNNQEVIVKKPTVKDRLKNPLFLVALSAFMYKLYTWLAGIYALPLIDSEDWRTGVDLLAYALIGVGITSTFTGNTKINK